jgi:hypothetical protein
MCARRFLIAVFLLTLLAVAAGFAVYQWGGNILLRQATPKGRFQRAPAGDAPDYANLESWISNAALNPSGTGDPSRWLPDGVTRNAPGEAHVFYIHPTTYFATDRWNAPLDPGPDADARTRLFVQSQASAFNLAGRIWAPRYRQAAYGAFLLKSENAEKALDLAYGDVAGAFDAFLSQAPEGGIILAGHSQGALHLERLLREKVAGKPVAERIIAAYVVGWPISTTADLPALGLPACRAREQSGCILSWMSFADPANPDLMFAEWEKSKGPSGRDRRRRDVLCVNPVTGVQDGAAAARANAGTLIPNATLTGASLEAGRVGGFCSNGLLIVDGAVPAFSPPPLPGNNFHVYDIALFWGSIRRDAATRSSSWNDHRQ